MEYQKIVHLLDNTSSQLFKFRTKMMNQEEHTILIVKSNSKLQC